LVIPARVTPRILPGVVDIPQGAWWKPDANGVDHGGNINVLTSHKWTPLAFGSAQQTIMVEVEKATKDEGRKTDAGKRSAWSSVFGPRSEASK
jgi:anaerobic selenocysteine-containing dehydrogenase